MVVREGLVEQGFSVPWLNREYLLQAVRGGEGGRIECMIPEWEAC